MKLTLRLLLLLILCSFSASCSQQEQVEISWEQLIRELYAPESIAGISVPCTEIYTSYDRSGGNNDYGNGFKALGNGWIEVADLKGPGALTRFWFTGLWKSRIRFVFDDESEPRLETTSRALFNGEHGLPLDFFSADQNCIYFAFPIPYEKRLRVLVSDDGYSQGKGKPYFQINAVRLKNKTVSSATFPIPDEVQSAATKVREELSNSRGAAEPSVKETFELSPGSSQNVILIEGPGMIRTLRIEPKGWVEMSFHQRRTLLRQVWMKISWDGSGEDSVRVPLGDFFGQMWEPKKLNNAYFSVDETGFDCRFPMPFRKAARITLSNYGKAPVDGQISIGCSSEPVPPGLGYFHSGWQRSTENHKGYPHTVLDASGKGRLAGCLLGVASKDRSFWVLESDETLLRDRSKEVFWQGTGLEDYFNGGWYYRTVFQDPLFGLTTKRPFRTVQYRFHLHDAVTFEKELKMSFERGPGNQSRAIFDSTVYYYLENPSAASGQKFSRSYVSPPADEFKEKSLMTRLWDYEKFDDYTNAEKLTRHAVEYWNYPKEIKSIFSRRVHAYQAHRSGEAAVGDSILFAYSNKKTDVFLDGERVLETSDPTRTRAVMIALPPGQHVLAVETQAGNWPDWVQVGLKNADGIFGIDPSWKCAVNPEGDWRDLMYNDDDWNQPFGVCKGPPEQEAVPFVYPDPFVGMQSMVEGARAHELPKQGVQKVVFRKVFAIK